MIKTNLYTALLGKSVDYKNIFHQSGDKEILLCVTSPGAAGEVCANKLWDIIRESCVQYEKSKIEDYIEDVLKVCNRFLIDFINRHGIDNFSAVFVARQGDGLHITSTGRGSVFLVRNDEIITITDQDDNSEPFSNLSSGNVEDGDLILMNSNDNNEIDPSEVSKIIFDNDNKAEAEIQIHSMVGDIDIAVALAVVSISMNKNKVNNLSYQNPRSQYTNESKPSNNGNILNIFGNKFSSFMKSVNLDKLDINKKMSKLEFKTDRGTMIFVLVILIFTLGVALYVKHVQSVESNINEEFRQEFDIARQLMDSASTEELYDEESAKAKYEQALMKMTALKEKGMHVQDIENKEKEIQQRLDKIDNITRVENPTVTISLSDKGISEINGIVSGNRDFRVFDYNNIFEIVANTSNDSILPYPVNKGVYDYNTNGAIFVTNDNKIIRWRDGRTETLETNDLSGWKNINALDTYAKNIYVLSNQDNQIWKYKSNIDGYSEPESYIVDDTNVSDVVSISIDGGIWALHINGKITHLFKGGLEDSFTPETSMINPRRIFSPSMDSARIYVLDDEARVTVFKKDGIKLGQYILNTNNNIATDIYVDEDMRKIFVSAGDSVYEVNM